MTTQETEAREAAAFERELGSASVDLAKVRATLLAPKTESAADWMAGCLTDLEAAVLTMSRLAGELEVGGRAPADGRRSMEALREEVERVGRLLENAYALHVSHREPPGDESYSAAGVSEESSPAQLYCGGDKIDTLG